MFLLLFLTLYFVFQVCVHVLLTVTIVMNPTLGKTVQDIFENIIRYVCRDFMNLCTFYLMNDWTKLIV